MREGNVLSPLPGSMPKDGSGLSGAGGRMRDSLIFDSGICNVKSNRSMSLGGSGGLMKVFADNAACTAAAKMGDKNGLLFIRVR